MATAREPGKFYLLPCACGREVAVEPRQAGESVRCECGRACSVPTMGEVRRLRPAAPRASIARSNWGSDQRYLLVGLVLVAVAVAAALIIFWQYPSQRAIDAFIEYRRQQVLALKPWEAIQHYRRYLEPGVDAAKEPGFSRARQMLSIGLVAAGVTGAIGAALATVGALGMRRKV